MSKISHLCRSSTVQSSELFPSCFQYGSASAWPQWPAVRYTGAAQLFPCCASCQEKSGGLLRLAKSSQNEVWLRANIGVLETTSFPRSDVPWGCVSGICKTPVHLELSQMCKRFVCAWLTSKSRYRSRHQNTEGARTKILQSFTWEAMQYLCILLLTIPLHYTLLTSQNFSETDFFFQKKNWQHRGILNLAHCLPLS